MHEQRDIICPRCGASHGPAAKKCECGQSLVVEEEPAPPKVFFALGLFFAVMAIWSSRAAEQAGYTLFPLGGMLFSSVACMLGVRSWLWRWRNRDRS